ncbi:uncharacterized protein LOC126562886 [Anopheles maculipalpis]|uniref:uncharacterized protein LOC126562886 n=1 Tax=Anopheles maculipalpis TaxID=1496333 RepID=UPI0021590678|nr:uncharacterized protein LOC126562886 [Anopheles maculipalpis]
MESDEENIEATDPPSDLFERIKSPIYNSPFTSSTHHPDRLWSAFEVVEEKVADIPHLDDTTISRQPFPCPAGCCRQPCCLFMFTTHISFDHKDVLVDTVWPSEPTTVLIDPYNKDAEQPRCHKLYLVSGKIRGLGDGKHRDKLPFVLMSSKLSLQGSDRLLLWVTGPDAGGSLRQHYTMEAGRNDHHRLLPYAVAFSGEIVPLHSSQDAAVIHQAGVGLVIPEQQIDSLTDSCTKLLEVCVHFY